MAITKEAFDGLQPGNKLIGGETGKAWEVISKTSPLFGQPAFNLMPPPGYFWGPHSFLNGGNVQGIEGIVSENYTLVPDLNHPDARIE